MARRAGELSPIMPALIQAPGAAMATFVRSLAGGAAYLHELVSGRAVSSDSQVTPPNPQGEIGVDLSGPPWGSAVRHPIAWCGGMLPSSAIGYGAGAVLRAPAGQRGSITVVFWVRPFEALQSPGIAPYSIGVVSMTGHRGAGASVTVGLDARNLATSVGVVLPVATNQTALSVTEAVIVPVSGDLTVPLVPGWNTIVIGVDARIATFDAYIDSLVINQIQKRSH